MNLLDFLQAFHQTSQLPMAVYEQQKLITCFNDRAFYPELAYYTIAAASAEHNVFYTETEDFLYFGKIKILDTKQTVFLGPASPFSFTQQQALAFLALLEQPKKHVGLFLGYLRAIPPYSLDRFRSTISFLNSILNHGKELKVGFLPFHRATPQARPVVTIPFYQAHTNSQAWLEQSILDGVEQGNLKAIEDSLAKLSTLNSELPVVTDDIIQSLRTTFITTAALSSRAAMRGGLDYNTTMLLSDNYLQKVYTLTSFQEISAYWREMILDFAKRVNELQLLGTDSLLVKQAAQYIQTHRNERITTQALADFLGKNRSYLCRHFKEETGKTITTYINEIKIAEAKRLLTTSNLPHAQIAAHLGFSSQNYFITVFKRVTNKTPSEYQKSFE